MSLDVSETSLKRSIGEFSLETIFSLNYSGKGLISLGCIPRCVHLCVLDLSHNQLEEVDELALLTELEDLNLSNNKISQFGGFDKLENLSRLDLSGNLISRFDTITPLVSLFHLKHFSLQKKVHSPPLQLTNPVCQESNYTEVMSETFPTLLWLDGEVVGKGAPGNDFYKEIRNVMNPKVAAEVKVQQHSCEELQVESPHPSFSTDCETDNDEREITELFEECKSVSNQVQKHINDLGADVPHTS